ncbi:MAG: hypothetical protein EXQ71_05695 [Acidimicrobiia bacterium]|nr:hypothetical protein [Acidimicrobiia bacterium]
MGVASRLGVAALVVLAACAGGGTDDDDGASLGDTVPPVPVTAPVPPAVSPEGTGVVVVGGTSSSFVVTACRLEAASPAASDPARLPPVVLVTGEGSTALGVPFTVEVNRFVTGVDVQTFTDTISYADTARILQAQRIEVTGQVRDLRDPDAATSLIRTRADGLSAVGIAGPPGADADADGTVGFALDATCLAEPKA